MQEIAHECVLLAKLSWDIQVADFRGVIEAVNEPINVRQIF